MTLPKLSLKFQSFVRTPAQNYFRKLFYILPYFFNEKVREISKYQRLSSPVFMKYFITIFIMDIFFFPL